VQELWRLRHHLGSCRHSVVNPDFEPVTAHLIPFEIIERYYYFPGDYHLWNSRTW
jgi:hypothetical protein